MQFDAQGNLNVTNVYVVDFLNRHVDNKQMFRACSQVLESFCKVLGECVENQSDQANTGVIMSFLKDMENRQKQYYEGIHGRLTESTSSIADKITAQMAGLIVAINNTTASLMQSIDTDSIQRAVIDAVDGNIASLKDALVAQIQAGIQPLRDDAASLAVGIAELPSSVLEGMNASELARVTREWRESHGLYTIRFHELEASMAQRLSALVERQLEHKELCSAQQQHLLDQMKSIPMLTKSAIGDCLRELDQHTQQVNTMLQNAQHMLQGSTQDIGAIKADTAQLSNRVESLLMTSIKNASSTKIKGSDGEERLFNLLCERLKSRDGYVVDRVSGQSHSCDIAIKREEFPTVRVESKAHGQGTNEKVRHKEVEKFQRDLLQANNHGIFVSLHSGIVGIGNVEVQQLPNGKFAVYLANNNYDIDAVLDMLQLIYKLDKIVTQGASVDNGELRVSVEGMTRIKTYLQDYTNKISSIKMHMRDSISILNEIHFDMIESVLLGQRNKKEQHACERCGKPFDTTKGLRVHAKRCSGAV